MSIESLTAWGVLPYIFTMADIKGENPRGDGKSTEKMEDSFVQRIINFFLGVSDPERQKKRELKQIKTQLKKRGKFFKVNGSLIQPAIGKFFYDIYQITGPAQVLLEKIDLSGVIKNVIIDHYLNEKELELRERLTDKSIRQRAEQEGVKAMASAVKEDISTFFSLFDSERNVAIEKTYNLLRIFLDFINFDYYFLLKKFDSSLPERDYNYKPRFDSINGEYILDDLKDFLEIMPLLDKDAEWDSIFDILSEYRSLEVISRDGWKKIVTLCRNMNRSRLLHMMVQYLDQAPAYHPTCEEPHERIVDDYLQMFKTQTELSVQKISQEKKNQKVENLLNQVFGTTAISRTKNYTEKANLSFSKKMMGGYLYVEPINYMKAFFLDFYKRDIRQLSDILLIRGQWATNVSSQQYSEHYHKLMEVADNLIHFDEALGEEGERGIRIKSLVLKSDKDKDSVTKLRKVLKEVNDEALVMTQQSINNLVGIAKVLKQLIGDYKAAHHEMVLNWKELQNVSDGDLGEIMTASYKKIYYFVHLLQSFVKSA